MENNERIAYICRFCERKFSSSQRLQTHLLKLKPCHISLMKQPNKVLDEKKRIVLVNEKIDENIIDYNTDDAFVDQTHQLISYKYPKLYKTSKNNNECPYCHTIFTNKYTVNAHIHVCKDHIKHINDTENSIQNHLGKVNMLLQQYQNRVITLSREKNNLLKQALVDSYRKTDIIAEQTKVQEKVIDALTYLQQNHRETPRFELPLNFQLSDEEIERHIKMGFPAATLAIFLTIFKNEKQVGDIPIWCLDPSRDKFAIKRDGWETEIGGKQIMKTMEPIHDMFMKYVIKQYQSYLLNNRIHEFNELQLQILKAYDDKVKKDFIKVTGNEFNISKLLGNN